MLETSLAGLVTLLAFAGGAALAVRLVRAVLRLALRAAEATSAAGLAEVSARRGDVTGMLERQGALGRARLDRRRALAACALWAACVAVPLFTGWAREAFAVASLLWLAPHAPIRMRDGAGA